FAGTVALTAHTPHDAEQLRAAGAHTVLEPFSAAAHTTSNTLHDLLSEDIDLPVDIDSADVDKKTE
ncbi:MAG: hypothetical protein ACPHCN_16820, partial [Mycobacterium sp.]